MRDVVTDVRRHAERRRRALAGGLQQYRRDCAVDVIVAVDEDGLVRDQRLPDTARQPHACRASRKDRGGARGKG